MAMRALTPCSLLVILGLCPVSSARGWQTQQDQLLSAARVYADRYMASLPSFICTQTVDQFESDKKARHWHKGDSLTEQLVWDQGREQRTLQLVNNRPLSQGAAWRSPLTSEGEFGNLLDSVLGDSSKAVFSWRGWDKVGARRVAVFAYHIGQQDSSVRLTFGSWDAVVPVEGLVFADADNGTVWRITNDTNEIPSELKTKSISRTVEYNEVAIGDNRYILPVHAVVLLNTGNSSIKNELWFDSYRKFSADSRISFSPADGTKSEPTKR
jgi:hypothetical protein